MPLWNGAQLAIDTTMVSQFEATALLVQGQPRSMARPWTLPERGRPEDTRNCPESTAGPAWSSLTQKSVADGPQRPPRSCAASPLPRPEMLPLPWEAVFVLRGSAVGKGMLGCAVARAFTESLLEGPATGGVDGPTPSMNDVLGDARFG